MKRFLLLLTLLATTAGVSTAQTTSGTLIGRAYDATTGLTPLGDVLVQVVHEETGYSRSTYTNAQGEYRISFIEPGVYRISGSLDGYYTDFIEDFPIALNKITEVVPPPLVLRRIGSQPPTPRQPALQDPRQKSQFASRVNTRDPSLRGNFTSDLLQLLPLAGMRSLDALVLLAPAVVPPPQTYGVTGPGIGPGVGTAGQFVSAGLRSRSNNFTIDGSDNNDQDVGVRRQGYTAPLAQTLESVQEFQFTSLLADAESGRNFGAQVNLVSRSGSNRVHATFYDLLTNDRMNARSFFDLSPDRNNSKPRLTRNQFGLIVSGPLKADRAHLFFAFERQDMHRSEFAHFSVPTASERPKSGLVISQDVFTLLPLPNNPSGPYGANTHTRELDSSGDGTVFSLKLTATPALLGRKHDLALRYNFSDDASVIPAVGGALNASIDSSTRTQNLALILTTPLGNRAANLLRFSYGRTSLGFGERADSPFIFTSSPANRIGVDFDLDGTTDLLSGAIGPVGRLTILPYSPIGVDVFTFPQGRTSNTFQIADAFSTTVGRHAIKFGADFRRNQLNSFLDRNFRAEVAFTGGIIVNTRTGAHLGSGLELVGLGVATNIFQTLATVPDSHIGLRFNELGLFLQDGWQLSSRLTISAGLRYDLSSVPVDVNRRIERTFSLDTFPTPSPEYSSPDQATAFNNALSSLKQIVDGRKKIYDGDHNNFAPRVGFAFDLTGSGRAVLRGGYGIYYDQILGSVVSNSRNVFPTFIPSNFDPTFLPVVGNQKPIVSNPAFQSFNLRFPLIQPGTVNTIGLPSGAFIAGISTLFSLQKAGGLAFTLPDRFLRTPYAHHYALTLETQIARDYLVTASYIGTSAHKLTRFRQPNLGPAGFPTVVVNERPNGLDVRVFQFTRPDKSLGAYTIFENSAASSYNALSLSLSRRYQRGFDLNAAYTYSHAIDYVSDVFDLAAASSLPQDESNLRAERASANFDIRHRFSLISTLKLPFHNPILRQTTLATVITLQTGPPFTVNSAFDVNSNGTLTDRLASNQGLITSSEGLQPIRVGAGVELVGLLGKFGQSGVVGRNSFRAGGQVGVDLGVTKGLYERDGRSLLIRLEVFNLFNRANFGIPVRILEAPGFGRAVSTTVPGRLLQLQARLAF